MMLRFLCLTGLASLAAAFPSGAGGCERNGVGSVGDAHLDAANVLQGNLTEGDYQVLIGTSPNITAASVLTDGSTIEIGVEYRTTQSPVPALSYPHATFFLNISESMF